MRIGLIGGTAMTRLADDYDESRIDEVVVSTKYGEVPLTCVSTGKNELIFLQRHHGAGMKVPHMINHRANIMALKEAGVEKILAICSVGTISSNFPPGSIGYATQYIDFTGVAVSFFESEAQFTSVTEPFDSVMNTKISRVLEKIQPNINLERTYWLTQGPQYETKAEINAIEKLGGDVIGMTMPRECKLSAELSIPYSAIVVASNWAAGREPGDSSKDLNHEEVSSNAESRLGPVFECIKALTQ
ncbi:MAG: MTAP family purine nucleoside phosphorylase [Candidatus Poseidoniaceae archaeon]|nr:MTAP family purine nucleoside phosphorylase [Candidatus Poseidoniaceae archaeon]